MEEAVQPVALELSDATKDTLAGALAGMAGVVAGQPLDLIRIRQQQPKYKSGNWLSMMRAVMRKEGPMALYRGVAYPFFTSALQNAMVFQTYGRACRLLHGDERAPGQAPRALPMLDVALGGAVSGLVQTSVCTPVELLKIRLQLQTKLPGEPGYVGSLRMLREIVRADGLRGLFRGTMGTAARDVPSFAAYFCSGASTAPLAALAAGGGVAGVACWMVSYPVDVAKSRVQARPGPGPGTWRTLRAIARQEGPAALFRGLPATLVRALLVNAAVFAVYEACHAHMADAPPNDDVLAAAGAVE
ncbi:hypothetical protein QBZ16_005279 [Prototheca wickerhamii]|uniref:Uncharacterized protein n=1 Tax=Prototheca wickerhamii TaxID=3111 RepID=A0AAD9IG91_PROWI|nr:hypothetical protein QBZ16_005279 [Prototheca wickerhamii]